MTEQALQAYARHTGIHHNTIRASLDLIKRLGEEDRPVKLPPAPWEGRE